MKQLFVLLAMAASLCACQSKDSHSQEEPKNKSANETSKNLRKESVIGSYVGLFGEDPDENNKITLLINYIDEKTVTGSSIVGGNDRPFEGSYTIKGDGMLEIEANEPGDNPYDGHFTITANLNQPDKISGSWRPFKNNTTPKSYTLLRRKFVYDPSVGAYPEASQRLLETAEVENLMKEDLSYMRNEIFARHGYCFQNKEWRQKFQGFEWYVPNSVSIKDMLTATEKKNIELIKRYEEYAQEYGDEFGR
jgi:hypothetical protein